MHSKALSMIGMARRAGKLSMGHDMVKLSVLKKKATLVILCADASQRLKNEFKRLAASNKVDYIESSITIAEIHFALGYKAAVMAAEDINFSNRITQLLRQEENAYDN